MRRPVRIGRPRADNSVRTGAALAAALLCGVLAQPALAQSVSTTGDIYTTNSTPLSSPTWTVGISGTDELVVGYPTLGTMLVEDGGQVINGNGYVGYIGAGTVTVRGSHPVSGDPSSWSNSGFLMVGDQGGTGILNIEQGGLVRASEVTIGSGSSSNGTINLLGDALSGRGVIETSRINAGNGTAALVIDGGVLRTTADGSFLNNFILPISIGSEGVWFDSNGHIMAVSPIFTGSGTFNKIGAGTVNLTGNSSGFGGMTIIEAGTLQFSGTSGFIAGNILNDSILSFNRSNAPFRA
ncbi:hypothetical protein [Devosia ginsengisoli]|uniref:Autotransporter outer membrane beta-barrel domain-containing protein n=1 Tax=Devosia ginsengisoli TaxID=400770 RepID=A0A5B8LSA7_9HYPH|nr:hypothetical protein [Devosia ginsengisoli]QDZ10110.1 hypothetical protein FPZ08_04725 [Devosia ginsengisoli]